MTSTKSHITARWLHINPQNVADARNFCPKTADKLNRPNTLAAIRGHVMPCDPADNHSAIAKTGKNMN